MNAINRPTRVLGIDDMKRELADVERSIGDVARLCSPRGNAILTKQVQRIKDVRLNLNHAEEGGVMLTVLGRETVSKERE